ncbi:cellulose binding domain-containing protein [Micromonospora sp. NPDC049497]|uniref:cellulose binding domain-containing protein n=1 Tax=Micromonospora sp. NPDC049497 TaxID=3364273 RepID=UPI003791B8D9
MSGTRGARQSSPTTTAIASSPWLVVLIGVLVMVVLLVVALGAYRGRGSDGGPRPDPAPPMLLPDLSPSSVRPGVPTPTAAVRPGLSPRATVLPTTAAAVPSASAAPSGAGGAGTPSVRPVAPAPAPPPVTGWYRVMETFDGGFIAEVLISNGASTDRGWTAALAFPGGRLVTAWVEGQPQGTWSAADGGFTYRSGADVPPGGTAPLRFHIERADTRPASCTVDGFACR